MYLHTFSVTAHSQILNLNNKHLISMSVIIPLTKTDREKAQLIQDIYKRTVIPLYKIMSSNNKQLKEISYTRKKNSDDTFKDEFGYYITDDIIELIEILEYFNCSSICDLGCGAGLLLMALKIYFRNRISCYGYDNEERLIEIIRFLDWNNAEKYRLKDILNLEKKDIQNIDALYFWEPFNNSTNAEKKKMLFIENLFKIVNKNQIIIYKSSGSTEVYLKQHFSFIQKGNFQIFKLK